MKTRLLLAFAGVLITSVAFADDWPQFGGPERNGVSKETGLLKAWPKGGPKLLWTFKEAGMGHSSFSVVKGVLYTLGTDMKINEERVIAIDAKTGTQLWTAKIGPVFNLKGNIYGEGPRSAPTIDGNLLFALGGEGDLVCIDLTSKKEVWRKNLTKDLGGEMMTEWGYSESPLVDGDLVLCTPGGKNGTMAALDKKSGAVKWRSKDWTDKAPYSSIIAADIHGIRQFIQTGYIDEKTGGVVAGVDAKTGNVLWKGSIFKNINTYAIAANPIVKGNLVYASSGYGGGCHLFEVDKNQKAKEQYKKPLQNKVKNTHGGLVLIDDHLYGHSETKMWICQDFKTGKIKWDERNKLDCASGAIAAADGLLYLFTDDAEVGLVEATPKGFNLLGQFTLPERSKLRMASGSASSSKPWAHPAIADGVLYLRDHELIFAYKIK